MCDNLKTPTTPLQAVDYAIAYAQNELKFPQPWQRNDGDIRLNAQHFLRSRCPLRFEAEALAILASTETLTSALKLEDMIDYGAENSAD